MSEGSLSIVRDGVAFEPGETLRGVPARPCRACRRAFLGVSSAGRSRSESGLENIETSH